VSKNKGGREVRKPKQEKAPKAADKLLESPVSSIGRAGAPRR